MEIMVHKLLFILVLVMPLTMYMWWLNILLAISSALLKHGGICVNSLFELGIHGYSSHVVTEIIIRLVEFIFVLLLCSQFSYGCLYIDFFRGLSYVKWMLVWVMNVLANIVHCCFKCSVRFGMIKCIYICCMITYGSVSN